MGVCACMDACVHVCVCVCVCVHDVLARYIASQL